MKVIKHRLPFSLRKNLTYFLFPYFLIKGVPPARRGYAVPGANRRDNGCLDRLMTPKRDLPEAIQQQDK